MNKPRITQLRVRRSAKAIEMAKLRTQRNLARKTGNVQEANRLEAALGKLAGM